MREETRVLLRRYNLNLLPILRELLRTKSVSRTAESVGTRPVGGQCGTRTPP